MNVNDPSWFVTPTPRNMTYVQLNSYFGLNNLRSDFALSTTDNGGTMQSVVIMDADAHAGIKLDSSMRPMLDDNGRPIRDDIGPLFMISNLASVDTNQSLSSALRYFSKSHRSVPIWNLMWDSNSFATQLPSLLTLRSTAPDVIQFYGSTNGALLKQLIRQNLLRNLSHLFNGPNSIRDQFPQRMIDAVTVDGTQCKWRICQAY